MNFYQYLESALESSLVITKEIHTQKCLEYCSQKSVKSDAFWSPKVFTTPSYASVCKIVPPRELPKRKDFEKPEGLAALIHAIAHIEYSAIDLALDAVYRYPHMPFEFKIDWLEVANDEIRHFKMLLELLKTLGYTYGSFAVHSGLFDVGISTAKSVKDRLAVVPRYYEASGLDVNPLIIKKLSQYKNNTIIQKTIEALEIILDEEIEHVQKGNKWFGKVCADENLKTEEEYFRVLDKYRLLERDRVNMNIEARKRAGFSCSELIELGAKKCEE